MLYRIWQSICILHQAVKTVYFAGCSEALCNVHIISHSTLSRVSTDIGMLFWYLINYQRQPSLAVLLQAGTISTCGGHIQYYGRIYDAVGQAVRTANVLALSHV